MTISFYYMTDTDAAGWYKGNTVPGANTIDAATHTNRMELTTIVIHSTLGAPVSTQLSDPNYTLNGWARKIYKRLMDGKDPFDPEIDEVLKEKYLDGMGEFGLFNYDPDTGDEVTL